MVAKPDWIIHYVQEHDCELCDEHKEPEECVGFPAFANAHTHGLNKHGHDEICICFDIHPQAICGLLNELGLRIRESGAKYQVGFDTSVLANGMRVEFYRPKDSKVLYMLLPDTAGRLPGEEGCAAPYSYQRTYADIIEQDKAEEQR